MCNLIGFYKMPGNTIEKCQLKSGFWFCFHIKQNHKSKWEENVLPCDLKIVIQVLSVCFSLPACWEIYFNLMFIFHYKFNKLKTMKYEKLYFLSVTNPITKNLIGKIKRIFYFFYVICKNI